MYGKHFFIDKFTCQGKLASVYAALLEEGCKDAEHEDDEEMFACEALACMDLAGRPGPVERFPAQCSHVKCSAAYPFQSYHGTRENSVGIPCYRRKNLEIVRDYNNSHVRS